MVLLVLAGVAAIVLLIWFVAQANDDDEPSTSDPTTSSAPTSSAPTTENTPSEESSSAPAEVRIDEDDYLGRPVDDVVAELRDKGLEVDTAPVDNPGDEDADTVASVSPTSGLVEGDTVTVKYYREAEPTSAPPSSDTSSPTPSESSSPSASGAPTQSGSPANDTTTPSATTPGGASASVASAPASPSGSRGAR